MKSKKYFLTLMLMSVCLSVIGQRKFPKITAADFATPAEAQDSTVDAVFVYEIGETYFTVKPTHFSLDTQVKARIHILTEEGRDYANKSLLYKHDVNKPSMENDDIHGVEAVAYNLVDGKVVKTSMPSKYIFKERVNENVMRLKFSVPDVKVGTIIEYKYIKSSPHFAELPTWVLQHEDPVRYSYYRATIPDWFNYHIEERGYKVIKGERKQSTINLSFGTEAALEKALEFTIEGENLRPFKHEDYIYCQNDYIQRVDFELVSSHIPGRFTKTYTMSWDDVREFLTDQADYNVHLKTKNPYAAEMASLNLEGNSVSVKASKLFALLKSKLKWDKTYALGTKNPLKAVREGKGSNIDLNFIYMAMLRDAGIKATPLLMRLRTNGRLPMTYASIDKLNTFIVAIADENGSLFFADGSAEYGDINILPVNLLAEGVLYNPSIATHPLSKPTRGEIYDLSGIGGNTSSARLDCIIDPKGTIQGQRVYNHIGFNALSYKNVYHDQEDSLAIIESKEKALGCKLLSFRVKNVEGTGMTTEERLRFTKNILVDGDKLYFNPLIFQDEKKNHFTQTERLFPVEFPVLQTTKILSNITIPADYTIETMPENQTLTMDGGYLSASITFEMKGNVLVTKYEMSVDNTFIPKEKYADLQEFWNKLLKANDMLVCLKKL